MLNDEKIGFIGGGNMAASLIGGLCQSGVSPDRILVADPDEHKCAQLAAEFAVGIAPDNAGLAQNCSVCVIAVKPQVLKTVLEPLQDMLDGGPLLISVAAGINIASLTAWSGGHCPVIRTMPNTPALIRQGASALFCDPHAPVVATERQKQVATSIMQAVGIALWVDEESQLDTVTALSGSGPAYFFYIMDALVHAASRRGLPADTARQLCLQTARGAAALAQSSDKSLARLRQNVTSPGGTTEQGIKTMQALHIEDILDQALAAAQNRSVELSNQTGE